MILYHVSYRPISQFLLRVPPHRLWDEDAVTPRICCSSSIENCINAKPQRTEFLNLCLDLQLPCIIFVYQFDVSVSDPGIFTPKQLADRNLVADAMENEEYWICDHVPFYQTHVFKVDNVTFFGDAVGKVILQNPNKECDFSLVDLSQTYSKRLHTEICPDEDFPDMIAEMLEHGIDIAAALEKYQQSGTTDAFDAFFTTE